MAEQANQNRERGCARGGYSSGPRILRRFQVATSLALLGRSFSWGGRDFVKGNARDETVFCPAHQSFEARATPHAAFVRVEVGDALAYRGEAHA